MVTLLRCLRWRINDTSNTKKTFRVRLIINCGLTLAALITQAGCSATNVLQPEGPTSLKSIDFDHKKVISSGHTGSVKLFELAYSRTYEDAERIAQGDTPPSNYSSHARTMADTGFHLVDDYCSEYFRNGGEEQKWLGVSRDVTIAAGTLATGILALTSSAGRGPVAVALGTVVLTNNLDIFSRNFLFGTDNIKSVQDLVQQALKEDRLQLPLARSDEGVNWTFQSASQVILKHQTICQQANILSLVRQAISNGKVTQQNSEFSKRNTRAGADNISTTQSNTRTKTPLTQEEKDNPALLQNNLGIF